jgi:hypothetical protein
MKITLSVNTRLQLDFLTGQQKGVVKDLLVWMDISKKLWPNQAEKELYIKDLGDGRGMIDQNAVKLGETIEVEFEKEETRRLISLLNEWPSFMKSDLEWILPLKTSLEDVTRK